MPKGPNITSPAGTAVWPCITEPDRRSKEDLYSVVLHLDPKEDATRKFCRDIKVFGAPKYAYMPFKVGKDSGMVEVRAKSKWRPCVYDSARHMLPLNVHVGSGSIIKMSVAPNTYEAGGVVDVPGVNLYLQAVQVMELRDVDTRTYGFEVEDGYLAPGLSGDETVADEAVPFNEDFPPEPTKQDDDLPF